MRAIAEGFAAESGLSSADLEFVGVQPQLVRRSATTETGEIREQVLGRAASFVRRLEGLPGGHLSIRVNGQGEVYSVVRNLRNASPAGRYPMLSPEEARLALHSPVARIVGIDPRGGPCTAVIERTDLTYYEGPVGWATPVLQPVYRFEGTAHYQAGWTREFYALVPAVRPEYTKL
ncbi:MAG: hypothetical protein ACE149_01665 [Armatimonadota bacterium]